MRIGVRTPQWSQFLAGIVLIAALPVAARDIKPVAAFTPQQLHALPGEDWLTNGGNLANQRYSPLTQINGGNVANLKGMWRTRLSSGGGAQHSGQGQPLVHDGVIYITTGASDVFAVDVESGTILWRHDAMLDARVRVCCGWVNRGVALGDGKVFVGQLDARLVALDQRTGKPVWAIQAEDPLRGFSIVSAPLYYDGMVITGFGGGEQLIFGNSFIILSCSFIGIILLKN